VNKIRTCRHAMTGPVSRAMYTPLIHSSVQCGSVLAPLRQSFDLSVFSSTLHTVRFSSVLVDTTPYKNRKRTGNPPLSPLYLASTLLEVSSTIHITNHHNGANPSPTFPTRPPTTGRPHRFQDAQYRYCSKSSTCSCQLFAQTRFNCLARDLELAVRSCQVP
jgi:hypothetical protein